MIFLAVDNRARMVPVEVAGYVGLQAVVTGNGLEKGQQVIVKGSKRVEDEMELQFR
jgi:RNA polymerase-interacting CarD/CdnL/TRCF family regulator